MKIIYHCFGGAHSSVTAASLHLGWLPKDRLPTTEELKALPYFDRPIGQDHGNIRFMGRDEFDNDIYVIGRRNESRVFENMTYGLVQVFGLSEDNFKLVNVMPYVNWRMVVGGYSSRKLKITAIGRPIIIAGVKYAYWQIVSLVQKVKVCIASDNPGLNQKTGVEQ